MIKKIAIQGIKGSFHDLAAKKVFGQNIKLVECMSFAKLCEALANDKADNAIMAIENSIAGTLLPNYALLEKYKFKIIGEIYLHIQMNLIALAGTKIKDVKNIISHPIAIYQCEKFLAKFKDSFILEKADTAACAKEISEQKLFGTAAIANELCASMYNLEILEKNIQTNKQNFTRFFVLAKQLQKAKQINKASIRFELNHLIGSLADLLMIFKNNAINLSKIQSIPVIGKPLEYIFNIDLEFLAYKKYQKAIQEALPITKDLVILGEYKKAKLEFNNAN